MAPTGGQPAQGAGKLASLLEAHAKTFRQARRDVGEVVPECPAPFGERDDDDALVLRAARAVQETRLLHPPQQRREGSRVELQALAEIPDGLVVAVPEQDEHEVLRVGQVPRLEQ